MGIILWIVFGALVGWIASMVMGTNARQGLLMDIVLGVIGALVGGFIMQMLGFSGISGFDLYSLVVAILGAIVLVAAARMINRG